MPRDGSLAYSPAARQPPAGWWRRLWGRLQGGRARRRVADSLYLRLVDQARDPHLYAAWGVPDTRDGRLEMVTLHALLVMRRLRREGPAGDALAQELFGVLFADLDRHLREWGVGDLSVGKEVRKLAQSFFGRVAMVDPLLSHPDRAALEAVLRRNVYTDAAADPVKLAGLVDYLYDQDRWLVEQDGMALLAGEVNFLAADPATRGHGTPCGGHDIDRAQAGR